MLKITPEEFVRKMGSGGHPIREKNLNFHLRNIFRGYSFDGRTMVDIGGGRGIYCFYAASQGATKAVCLEPEASGATSGISSGFEATKTEFGLPQVDLISKTYQDYVGDSSKYDLVVMHNSINHLNEEACEKLGLDSESEEIYTDLFREMFTMMNPGGTLLACDASCTNYWNQLGFRSPFAKSIEWHKHQEPETWSAMLQNVGFEQVSISWNSFNSLGGVGRSLLGHRAIARFFNSHFRLEMRRP